MAKIFDPQIVNPIITRAVEDLITSKGGLVPTKPFDIETKPIEEYEDRLRVNATDTFDVAVFIAVTNFYLNRSDLQAHRARGAVIIYMDSEVADKLFKAAGLEVPYDEDDGTMQTLCGSLCESFSKALKDGLAAAGYANLEVSPPSLYKNTVPEGVEFSKEQDEKQQIAFFYLKHKALVIDWTMAPIPKK